MTWSQCYHDMVTVVSQRALCAENHDILSAGIPDLVGSDDEDDAPHAPASDHHLHLQDLATAARFAAAAQSRVPDDMPGLVTSDDSGSDSVPDLESDPDYAEDADDHLDHDSEYESDLSDEDEDDDALPPLVDIQRGLFTASFTDLSNTQPMTLDQLDAVDRLSHILEESEDVAASGNLVCFCFPGSAPPPPPSPPSPRVLKPASLFLCNLLALIQNGER